MFTLSVHVTLKLVAVGQNWAEETHPRRLPADVHMPAGARQYTRGTGKYRAHVTYRAGHNAVQSSPATPGHGQADTKAPATSVAGATQSAPLMGARGLRGPSGGVLCAPACKIGARRTCNGRFLVRMTNQEEATASEYATSAVCSASSQVGSQKKPFGKSLVSRWSSSHLLHTFAPRKRVI